MKISILAVMIPVLLCAISFADFPSDWKTWKDASGNIQSIQADFVQTKTISSIPEPLISKGRFYFKAPDYLRWEYTEPIQVIALVRADQVKRMIKRKDGFVENSGSAQEALRRIMKNMSRWMKCEFDNDPDFAVSFEKANTITLTPTRKVMEKYIQSVEIERAETPGVIRSVFIHEGKQIVTRIEFQDVAINKPIPQSIFENP